MKTKFKIAATVIPALIVIILLINITFGFFFRSHILEHEKVQVQSAGSAIASYIHERMDKYSAAASDWGHWADTNDFILGRSLDYVELNMTETVYHNLDLSFMILSNNSDEILYQQYYAFEKETFCDFPNGFAEDIGRVISFSQKAEGPSGIIRAGGAFYFVSTSGISDPLNEAERNGTLIFGRQIDERIIAAMEGLAGCSIQAFSVVAQPRLSEQTGPSFTLQEAYLKDPEEPVRIELTIPNVSEPSSSIRISMSMLRTLYASGIREIVNFSIRNTMVSLLLSIAIFLLLGRYISRPFNMLMKDVRAIRISDGEQVRIPEGGTDEFAYLRRSVNELLQKIESSQRALVESKEKLQATLASVGDGVITVSIEGIIEFMNPVAQDLTGWTLEEAAGMPLETVLNIVNELSGEPFENPVKAVYESGQIVQMSNPMLLIGKNGQKVPVEDTVAPIRDSEGTITGAVLIFRDCSLRKEKQRYTEYLSYHDPLTDLHNRRYFEEALQKIDTADKLPLSFIYADVNGLKAMNDAFGHDRGDELIKSVAAVIRSVCRSGDVIARIGGDEFVIILPEMDGSAAEELARSLEKQASRIRIMDIPVSISVGWGAKTSISQSAKDVLRHAEKSMYQEKEAGVRNR